VTDQNNRQPGGSIIGVNSAKTLTAGGAFIDLLQIAFEELSPAARGASSGYRANDRRPDAFGQM
jgi:hypothetical protein